MCLSVARQDTWRLRQCSGCEWSEDFVRERDRKSQPPQTLRFPRTACGATHDGLVPTGRWSQAKPWQILVKAAATKTGEGDQAHAGAGLILFDVAEVDTVMLENLLEQGLHAHTRCCRAGGELAMQRRIFRALTCTALAVGFESSELFEQSGEMMWAFARDR